MVSRRRWLAPLLLGAVGCSSGPTRLETTTAISIGTTTGCALRRDGEVLCWGGGPVRDESTARTVMDGILAKPAGISAAVEISVGNGSLCAVLASGTVQCRYGTNPGIASAAAVSSGYQHWCALLADGTIQCWGSNVEGELGRGTFNDTTGTEEAAPVTGIVGAVSVHAGYSTTCATLTDGTVRCWGVNSYGQLGDGTTTDSSVPLVVAGLTGVADACTGSDHSCARMTDGTVRCWGANALGQLGDGTRVDSVAPVAVAGVDSATAIACGFAHTCALLGAGSVQCWGADGGDFDEGWGALGHPGGGLQDCKWAMGATTAETGCAPAPVEVSGITDAMSIAAGLYSSCAVLADGSARCWGSDLNGQLGDGTTWTNGGTPVTVME